MNKKLFKGAATAFAVGLALCLPCGFEASAQVVAADSTYVEQLSSAVVVGVRAQKEAPFAVSNVSRGQLNSFSKSGQELPRLFSQTPGVLGWSENGVGTGTCYLRIRGTGDSRINVTLDGVPRQWADSARSRHIYQW